MGRLRTKPAGKLGTVPKLCDPFKNSLETQRECRSSKTPLLLRAGAEVLGFRHIVELYLNMALSIFNFSFKYVHSHRKTVT